MPSEKYTTRDLMLQMVGEQKKLLQLFSNGKFVSQLQKGMKEQTMEIVKEIGIVQATTKETKSIVSWVRYTSFGIIAVLTGVDLTLLGLYIKELLN